MWRHSDATVNSPLAGVSKVTRWFETFFVANNSHLFLTDKSFVKIPLCHTSPCPRKYPDISHLSLSSHGVLRTLCKLKHFTDFNLRKRLAELLVSSRLDYCDPVFSPQPRCLLKRLQKIEFAAASFVYGRYVNNIGDILKLNWLPVEERKKGF